MNCRDCNFYSNRESQDFGRTNIIKCNKTGTVADPCSENSGDENRAIDRLQSNCPLGTVKVLKAKMEEYKITYFDTMINITSDNNKKLFNEILELVNRL